MEPVFLYMAIVGCTPPGRFTEQHDVFFGIGPSPGMLVPDIERFWPEAGGRFHLDAWRKVTAVNGYRVWVVPNNGATEGPGQGRNRLFFLNLGGYRPGEFEEYHYKMLVAAPDAGKAVSSAKKTAFYRHTRFRGAESHIDDKYGVDVDDLHVVEDILAPVFRQRYRLVVSEEPDAGLAEDELHIGYFRKDKL